MPDVTYPKNANSDTVFVEDGGKKTRAIKTVEPDGTVTYPSNANSENCYVTIDGKKQRALMTAPQDTSTLEYPNNPNSTKGYVTVNGKKQRVVITANIAGGGGSAVIDSLNVTPTTSAQTITATGGVDGYSPVNVSAVDASIDANIVAGNIKDGVTILGVTGNVVELNGETKTVTPQVYGQTLYPTAPKNGITEITVNAVTHNIDANIQAGNIKKDVSILGVTGTYEGTTPTGTKSITSNGIHDVAGYANADVQVPTTAPALYREFQLDGFGTLIADQHTTHIMDFTGITGVSDYMLTSAYRNNNAISGAVDMSDLTTLSGAHACYYMFYNCTGLTSADLSALTTVNGTYACNTMFGGCTGLTSVDLSSLTTISASNSCYYMFQSCTGLTSVDLSALTTISANSACAYMFASCTGLTSADLSGLTTVSGTYACLGMFQSCTSLATVYIGGTTAINFGGRTNVFNSMFSSCTQNIDVYAPAANQTAIEAFSDYPTFGGTGTVTWHWRS